MIFLYDNYVNYIDVFIVFCISQLIVTKTARIGLIYEKVNLILLVMVKEKASM